MSISRTNFLKKVWILLNDYITGTTTSAGSTGGDTFIDSSLKKYPDGHFGDPERDPQYWAYIGTSLLPVKKFIGNTGTVVLHNAYESQISSSSSYELHRFDRDDVILACNQALYECFPDYYLRIDDETSLDGLGSSDIDYEVPSTAGFVDFPDQIWKKHTSSTASDAKITYTQITDYDAKLVDGTWKFYADITEDDDVLLVGRTYLTQFGTSTTGDATTTELTDGQANTVAYLAASIFYRNMTNVVNADNSGRYDALADRFAILYEQNASKNRMPRLMPRKASFGWLDE